MPAVAASKQLHLLKRKKTNSSLNARMAQSNILPITLKVLIMLLVRRVMSKDQKGSRGIFYFIKTYRSSNIGGNVWKS